MTTLPDEVRELLALDSELGERLAGLPIADQRRVIAETLEQWASRAGVVVADVARCDDFTIPVDGGEVRLRQYTPPAPCERPHPAFFHIHGGGFTLGSIDGIYNAAKCAHICASAGVAVTTVEYRLAPEFPFPTAPEDCYAALLWVVDHAGELGIDPTRIAIGGESAGGNLAAVVALMSRDRGGPPLALQVLEVPVADMSRRSVEHPSFELYGVGYGLDRTAIESFEDDYLPAPIDRDAAYVSPLRADDLTGLPPAHIITAELDPLRDGGEAYGRRLREAGVSTTTHRFIGHTHGSSVLWSTWPPATDWMDEVVAKIAQAVVDPVRAA
jgi:acetyl esterase/lipase